MSWNPAGFQYAYEICQISWSTTKFCIFHEIQYRYTHYMLNMQCISPWHEICWISWPWNLLNFMKSAKFHHEICTEFHHEICRISWPWNPPNFTLKSTKFHDEICQISPWNLPDVMAMKSGRFHDELRQISCPKIRRISWPWNPADSQMS